MSDIKDIPYGPYCYFGSRAPKDPTYKVCKYWERVDSNTGRCNLLNIQDYTPNENGEESLSLWDKVKECGINKD